MIEETQNGGASRQPPTKVFSIRLTERERELLGEKAGVVPMGAYVRQRLFSPDEANTRLRRHRGRSVDQEALSRVLASLGQSRLSSNLNQLAKAVHLGVLPVTPETELELTDACRAVSEMRGALMKALGLSAT
jgi:hypothetical protein